MMATVKKSSAGSVAPESRPTASPGRNRGLLMGAAVAAAAIALMVGWWKGPTSLKRALSIPAGLVPKETASPEVMSVPVRPETLLTRESIDHVLEALDRAIRLKDVEGVLQYLAPSATITIHMKQGSQQQSASLTRDEYRTTLRMRFAFPSGND